MFDSFLLLLNTRLEKIRLCKIRMHVCACAFCNDIKMPSQICFAIVFAAALPIAAAIIDDSGVCVCVSITFVLVNKKYQ